MNLFLFHVIALSVILSGAVLYTPQNMKEFYTAFAKAYGTQFDYTKAPCFNSATPTEFMDLFSELAGRAVLSKNTSHAFKNLLQRNRNETLEFINKTLSCMIEFQETVMMFGSFDEYLISKTFMPEDFSEFLEVFPEDSLLLMTLMEYFTSKQDFNKTGLTLALLFQQTKQYQKGFIKYRRDLTNEDPINASTVEYTNLMKGICKSIFLPCFYDSKLCWEFEDTTCTALFLSNLTLVPLKPKEKLTENIKKFIDENLEAFKSCVSKDTWTCEHKTGDYMTFKSYFQGSFWDVFEHLDKYAEAKPDEMIFFLQNVKRLFARQNYEAIGLLLGPMIDHAAGHVPKPNFMNAMPMDSSMLTKGYNNEL